MVVALVVMVALVELVAALVVAVALVELVEALVVTVALVELVVASVVMVALVELVAALVWVRTCWWLLQLCCLCVCIVSVVKLGRVARPILGWSFDLGQPTGTKLKNKKMLTTLSTLRPLGCEPWERAPIYFWLKVAFWPLLVRFQHRSSLFFGLFFRNLVIF